jgi:D-3-phosphoglycerate dehydrogenase
MPARTKTVVRSDVWMHPDLTARFAREPDIDLVTLSETDEAAAWAALARADAYQISSAKDELDRRWHAHDELFERAPNLLCVSATGAGYDTVDVPACTRAGVLVVNQAGANACSVAQHTIGLILALTKRICETDRMLRSSRGYRREEFMGRDIAGWTIGLVGIGHVGRRVAALARAFEMEVLACDPYLDAAEVAARGALKVELGELLEQSDIVSLHCPRDASTLRMIDAAALQRMKPGALLINTARGGIHDEAAVEAALDAGHLAGAGLDVWDAEPPPLDHPLLKRRDVVATFHTAGVTREARANIASYSAEQLIGVLRGGYPPRPVNPEVWPAYAARFERLMGFAPVAAG